MAAHDDFFRGPQRDEDWGRFWSGQGLTEEHIRHPHLIPMQQHSVSTKVVRLDWFVYRHDRPMRWLQRLALWVLKRLHCYYIEDVTTFRTVALTGSVRQKVWAMMKQLSLHGGQAERLVCGPEAFQDLVEESRSEPAPHTIMSLDLQKFLGVPVQVLPWLEGIALIPRIR